MFQRVRFRYLEDLLKSEEALFTFLALFGFFYFIFFFMSSLSMQPMRRHPFSKP